SSRDGFADGTSRTSSGTTSAMASPVAQIASANTIVNPHVVVLVECSLPERADRKRIENGAISTRLVQGLHNHSYRHYRQNHLRWPDFSRIVQLNEPATARP